MPGRKTFSSSAFMRPPLALHSSVVHHVFAGALSIPGEAPHSARPGRPEPEGAAKKGSTEGTKVAANLLGIRAPVRDGQSRINRAGDRRREKNRNEECQ